MAPAQVSSPPEIDTTRLVRCDATLGGTDNATGRDEAAASWKADSTG